MVPPAEVCPLVREHCAHFGSGQATVQSFGGDDDAGAVGEAEGERLRVVEPPRRGRVFVAPGSDPVASSTA